MTNKTGDQIRFKRTSARKSEPETALDVSDIKLTPEKAGELVEWIFLNDNDIFSEDDAGDLTKQALLILITALTYETDASERENILFVVTRKVFGYTHAINEAEEFFIKNGFETLLQNQWQKIFDENRAKKT